AVSRARLPARLSPRDRAVSGTLAVAFLAAAAALAALAPDGGRAPGAIEVAAFAATYAVCSRIEFEVSSGTGVPTMLVLVPMLFVPVGLAAALVAADHRYAWLLVLPVAVLLGDMARDRRARITEALRLAHAYRVVNRSARRDPLTGIGNRLAWDEAVALADAS